MRKKNSLSNLVTDISVLEKSRVFWGKLYLVLVFVLKVEKC